MTTDRKERTKSKPSNLPISFNYLNIGALASSPGLWFDQGSPKNAKWPSNAKLHGGISVQSHLASRGHTPNGAIWLLTWG